MSTEEKEARISALPFPLRGRLELAQAERGRRLDHMDEPEAERVNIQRDYEAVLDRILDAAGY